MFTGLIEDVGTIKAVEPIDGGLRVTVDTRLANELALGDSIAVNGVCLTVVTKTADTMQADVGPETQRVTTFGRVAAGRLVNLERPMRADSRFGGHFVLGHVDAVGRIEAVREANEFHWFTVSYPGDLSAYFIPKGSVAVDGISLTVARLEEGRFDVQIVPFTMEHTNLRALGVGDPVNLECDVVGKYVVRAAATAARAGLPQPLDVSQ